MKPNLVLLLLLILLLSACSSVRGDAVDTSTKTSAEASSLTYLSDSQPPYAILESIQKQEFQKLKQPSLPNQDWTKECMETFRRMGLSGAMAALSDSGKKESKKIWDECRKYQKGPLPTRYESPFFYPLAKKHVELVERAIKGTPIGVNGQVYFGSAPTIAVDARYRPIPGSQDSLVVLNSGIFILVHEMNKIALWLVPLQRVNETMVSPNFSEEFIKKHFSSQLPKVREYFDRSIRQFLGFKPFHTPILTVLEAPLDAMDKGIEWFIVGHEFGHVLQRQNAEAGPSSHRSRDTTSEELEADRIGFDVLLRTIDQHGREHPDYTVPKEFQILAPLTYFSYYRPLDEAIYACKKGAIPTSEDIVRATDHPSNMIRAERARQFLTDYVKHKSPDQIDHEALAMGLWLGVVLQTVWDEIRSEFLLQLTRGECPHFPREVKR